MNPLLDEALKIGLDTVPQESTDNMTESDLPFDPENPPMPRRENSFEGFMGSFGSPGRWAGGN